MGLADPIPAHTLAETDCYHCGEPLPEGLELGVEIEGQRRPMCCPGCAAVARMIAGSGMDSFYRQRTAYAPRPQPDAARSGEDYRLYDDPEIASGFAEMSDDGLTRARLLLGGMTCAACTWLVEQSLARVPGVVSARVNLQQSRLDMKLDTAVCALSEVFARVEALGYQPRPFQASTQRSQLADEYRSDLRRLGVAGVGMMQVGMFAVALHAGDIQGIAAEYQALLRWVSLVVASAVVFFSARPFFTSAWRHLRQGMLVMDLPVALAIGLAFLASLWATVSGTGQVYFDSVVMFTFFLLLGRFLERRARQRHSLTWFDAEGLLPDAVSRYQQGRWQLTPRRELCAGDRLLIRQGDTLAVDAQVLSGQGSVQEASLNGEFMPRAVAPGATIYAGTVNLEGKLEARALGGFPDTRLAALQRSVEAGESEKPRLARLADRVAGWFIAGILLVTAATAAVWSQLQPEQALWVTLSVLVISCPCALALATPAALASAAGALRASGVIVRGENALEALARASHLVFDKTGTLTAGNLRIAKTVVLADLAEHDCLALCAALQQHSSHPVGRAFGELDAAADLDRVDYRVGAGLEGYLDNTRYRVGSEAFCRELAPGLSPPPDEALYWIALCEADRPLAWVGLDDSVREEAAQVVAAAQAEGLAVELLTGDNSGRGPALAAELGIGNVRRGCSPEQKMARVRELQAGGAVVAMVGDGLNDAPVLGLADASFAVAGATGLARTQADFVIVDGDLRQILRSWQQARHCRRIILQNLAWALGYNLCAIPLAATGHVPPWAAAIGMSLSSLLVVLNSLRLNNAVRT